MNRLLDFIEYFEDISDRMFVPRIDREDGLVLYTIISTMVNRYGKFIAVDAGAGVGYSTLWIVAPLEDLCVRGTVFAVEWNRERYEVLKKNFSKITTRCVDVEVVNQNAVDFIETFGDGDINFAFVDIDKNLYRAFLVRALSKIAGGGVIAFHNAYMVHNFYKDVIEGRNYMVFTIPTSEGILLIKLF
ncbi:MAG: class I SAM-dependent methyltransferase [Ignisphaera sp.]